MIDYLRHMAIFSAVADKGSFSEAAQALGIAPSRVSESVSRLEHYLDTTLLTRTTRKVTLTSEGRQLYAHTASMVGEAQEGLSAIKNAKATPSGTLRISVPSYLTASPLLAAIGAFGEAYPDVHIAISFHDENVDPIRDGFDLCIRGGAQDYTGSVEMRKLGDMERGFFVGRGYLESRQRPEHPKDLERWDWITYRYKMRRFKLVASGRKRTEVAVAKTPKLQVDNLDALHFLVKSNLGVAVMPIESCRNAIADGSIIRLFEDWRLAKVRTFAVWPEKTHRASLTTTFVDFILAQLDASKG